MPRNLSSELLAGKVFARTCTRGEFWRALRSHTHSSHSNHKARHNCFQTYREFMICCLRYLVNASNYFQTPALGYRMLQPIEFIFVLSERAATMTTEMAGDEGEM